MRRALQKKSLMRVAVLCAIVVLMFSGCSGFNTNKKTLYIGTDASYRPYEFRNKKGDLVGYDIDFAKALAKKLGRKLSIDVMDFHVLPEALEAGTIDLIISALAIFPQREKQYVLIPYHSMKIDHFELLFWKTIPPRIKTIEDLIKVSRLPISAPSGTYQEYYLKQFKDAKIIYRPTVSEVLLDLRMQRSLAILIEPRMAQHMMDNYTDLKAISVPLKPSEQVSMMGIGVKRGNEELITQVRQALEELRNEGVMDILSRKWLKKDS